MLHQKLTHTRHFTYTPSRFVHCGEFSVPTHFMLCLSSPSEESLTFTGEQHTSSEMGHTVNIFLSCGHSYPGCHWTWKQPRTSHEWMSVAMKPYLQTPKFGFSIICACQDIGFLLLTYFPAIYKCKYHPSSRTVETQAAGHTWPSDQSLRVPRL